MPIKTLFFIVYILAIFHYSATFKWSYLKNEHGDPHFLFHILVCWYVRCAQKKLGETDKFFTKVENVLKANNTTRVIELKREIRSAIHKAKLNYKDKVEAEFRSMNAKAAFTHLKCMAGMETGSSQHPIADPLA